MHENLKLASDRKRRNHVNKVNFLGNLQMPMTPIFPPWCVDAWQTVDDRVRGGKSVSRLRQCNGDDGVVFSGALGGNLSGLGAACGQLTLVIL